MKNFVDTNMVYIPNEMDQTGILRPHPDFRQQAEDFCMDVGYEDITRFPDFPEGYFRVGFRKVLAKS